MILGDNIFYGNGFSKILKTAAANAENKGRCTVFGYYVQEDVYKRQASEGYNTQTGVYGTCSSRDAWGTDVPYLQSVETVSYTHLTLKRSGCL